MADEPTTASELESATSFSPPSYIIDEADEHHADAILALDPLRDVASGAAASKSFQLTGLPPLSALSPELRAQVEHELRAVPVARRAESEAGAIASVLEANGRRVRPLLGNGEGDTPFHAELADIAREVLAVDREFDRLAAQMVQIARHDTSPDGKPIPIYVMSKTEQDHAKTRMAELAYRRSLLVTSEGRHGPEAQRRLDKALHDAVEQRKQLVAQLEEHREAERRAEQILRDERINAKATAMAKRKRVSL